MEVEDGLSGAGADVEDGAVSLLDVALAGDLSGGEVAAADEFGVGGLGDGAAQCSMVGVISP